MRAFEERGIKWEKKLKRNATEGQRQKETKREKKNETDDDLGNWSKTEKESVKYKEIP